MPTLTGLEGVYNSKTNKVVPKDAPQKTWSKFTEEKTLLTVVNNFKHYPVALIQPKLKKTEIDDFKHNPVDLIPSKLEKVEKPLEIEPAREEGSFFSRSSLGRSILIGVGVGVLVIAVIAVVFATSEVGSAVFGFAATTLGLSTLTTGLSLAAIATGIVGLCSGLAAGIDQLTNKYRTKYIEINHNDAENTTKCSTAAMFNDGLTPNKKNTPDNPNASNSIKHYDNPLKTNSTELKDEDKNQTYNVI